MAEVKVTKSRTITTIERTKLELDLEDVEIIIRNHFALPAEGSFSWDADRYGDVHGVVFSYEKKDTVDADL
ncbi:hypothetical protein [Sphingomonas jaspsi]|uniref:hypothetical protein n=1 Tax=Sphingomonas jaspsi TaxID=392409 RepID=UPI0004B9BB57|nr:hypothetical protein [Sphingomonas jaspsi]